MGLSYTFPALMFNNDKITQEPKDDNQSLLQKQEVRLDSDSLIYPSCTTLKRLTTFPILSNNDSMFHKVTQNFIFQIVNFKKIQNI
jgi:hypothetical protein